MPTLNLVKSTICIQTELEPYHLRKFISDVKNSLGLVYFDEYHTSRSYGMVIDGKDVAGELQYRVCLTHTEEGLYKYIELTACGSDPIDRFKAWMFRDPDMVFSLDLSIRIRDVLAEQLVLYDRELSPWPEF